MSVIEKQTSAEKVRILVMDDDAQIRKILGLMLDRLGYQTEAVSSGAEALKLYQAALQSGRPYRAAILDLTIGHGMDGPATLAALKQLDPGVRAIVATGHARDTVLATCVKNGFRTVLAKPFRLQDVENAVRQALA